MKVHKLKIFLRGSGDVFAGNRRVELRHDGRGYEVGDLLHLREWDRFAPVQGTAYTGREQWARVTHLLTDPDGKWLQPGVVAISIENVYPPDADCVYCSGRGHKYTDGEPCPCLWNPREENICHC